MEILRQKVWIMDEGLLSPRRGRCEELSDDGRAEDIPSANAIGCLKSALIFLRNGSLPFRLSSSADICAISVSSTSSMVV